MRIPPDARVIAFQPTDPSQICAQYDGAVARKHRRAGQKAKRGWKRQRAAGKGAH